ncbi:BlaI/MecI/CopY family transcriptional regulator [Gorillibacterium timonense]|uniref:BlaI/MecI/CopY family transcriptional regulator n=1 Tax=Gorillibacterium timonense TaxID=1689269 RepID=UPI00071C3983|nr:BlaI/MecI/CopY family transcriptional regulator [Gorillibacterium timonense]
MDQVPQISESELIIMTIIWDKGNSARFAEIMEELDQLKTEWKKSTVLTFLSRLIEKNMLSTRKFGRRNEYTALMTRNHYQAYQTKQFLDKVYSGNVQGLVHMLVQNHLISDKDVEELREFWREGQPDE